MQIGELKVAAIKMQFGGLKIDPVNTNGFQKSVHQSWIDLKILPHKQEEIEQEVQQVVLHLYITHKLQYFELDVQTTYEGPLVRSPGASRITTPGLLVFLLLSWRSTQLSISSITLIFKTSLHWAKETKWFWAAHYKRNFYFFLWKFHRTYAWGVALRSFSLRVGMESLNAILIRKLKLL